MESQRQSKPSPAPSRPGPLSSFVRFVVCGGGVGLLSSAAVPMLAAAMPWAVANALVTVAGTLLCTELHALFTFGTGRRPDWRRHMQASGSAVAAYLATTAAMFALYAVQPSPGMVWEQTVYLTASGLAGVGRFLVLRLFVFADRNERGGRGGRSMRSETLLPGEPNLRLIPGTDTSRRQVAVTQPALVPSAA
ncbi:GtrA family protein [Streptomyces sp. KS_5]|uniref:GtrA family protein n=1 Tax=Streptomyces TaxID=1883 RepID=UPI00089B855F|nr:GtrA family protein [Streptomyces sp. KS_5]SEC96294.1 Putative flippase GtrA (transmembrane translocase of bactoprenol-linked glucose) [Streptomyces sp. KS_5]